LSLEHFRWGMYSLFIGLTLGGAPLLKRMIGRLSTGAIVGVVAGVIVMIGLVVLQSSSGAGSGETNSVMLGLGGAAGASAMILPGVSGAYLLLLLGQYEPIVNAIKSFVSAAKDADVEGAIAQLGVIIPVGIGVVVGVVVVANILRVLLHRFEKPTLGVLLGLLIAAPAGLYPFREGVQPQVGDTIKGEVLTAETVDGVDPKDWPQQAYTPGVGKVAGSVALILIGFGATLGIDRLGADRKKPRDA
jgi:putative membrane protein